MLEKFYKYPWVIVCVITLITVFFVLQLPKASMDNNIAAFLPEDNPACIITKHLEEEYGSEITIMIGLERPYGTVFDNVFLDRVREFIAEAKTFPLVKNINSLLSAQYITSDNESIIVTDLVDISFSGKPNEIAELKRRIASWDMYQGSFISDDLSSTQIVITIDALSEESGNPEVVAVLNRLRDTAKETFAGYASVYLAGLPVVAATITESTNRDVIVLIPFVTIVLLSVLVLSFRRFNYIVLPILTVLIATIWAIGAMPLFGVTMTMLCTILPVILSAVGSAYAIHIVSHYKDKTEYNTFTIEEHRILVLELVRKLLKPVFLAALTTFGGFISFSFAPLKPMREFGIFASFGVVAAFLVAITLIPAILLILGTKTKKSAKQKTSLNFENTITVCLNNIIRKKSLMLIITIIVLIVSIIGSSKVIVDNAVVEFFKSNTEVSRSDRFIRERFGGSTQLVLSVEAEDTKILLSPHTLSALDNLCTYLIERVPRVTKVTGFTDMIKRMNQLFNIDESPEGIKLANQRNFDDSDIGFGVFNFDDSWKGNIVPSFEAIVPVTHPVSSETNISFAMLNAATGNRPNMTANDLMRELKRMTNYEGYSYYEIPTNLAKYGKESNEELQQLIANYLVLLAGQSEMSNDPLEPTAIQTIILINSQWQRDSRNVIKAINNYVSANFPKNVRVLIGGGATVEGAVTDLVVESQIISILASIILVLLIVAFFYKSISAGIIAALPLSIATIANFAVMGFLHITINVATALTSSLAVGIGIDYTIHFINAFKQEYIAGGDYLNRTFSGTGKAILVNAISVGAGFGVLSFSQFRVLSQFGGLIALSMFISAIVSLTVIPVLITTIKPKFIYTKENNV